MSEWSGPNAQQYPSNEPDGVKRLIGVVQDVAQKARDATKNLLRTAGIFLTETGMRIESALTVNGDFASTGSADITGTTHIGGSTDIDGDTDIAGTLNVDADATFGSSVRVDDMMDIYGQARVHDGAGFTALYPDGAVGAYFGPLHLVATGAPDGVGLNIQGPTSEGKHDVFRAKYDGAGQKRVLIGETGFPVKDVWGLSETWYLSATDPGTGANASMHLHSEGDISLSSATYTVRIPWFTTSSAANMFIDNDGRIWKSTSARKYKQDIEDASIDTAAVLKMRPRTWRDRAEVEGDPESKTRYVGFIAEELDDLGLGEFVTRKPDGEVEGIAYDRLVAAVIPVLQDIDERLRKLELPR